MVFSVSVYIHKSVMPSYFLNEYFALLWLHSFGTASKFQQIKDMYCEILLPASKLSWCYELSLKLTPEFILCMCKYVI